MNTTRSQRKARDISIHEEDNVHRTPVVSGRISYQEVLVSGSTVGVLETIFVSMAEAHSNALI